MNKGKLREMILAECGCMAREVELPGHLTAAMPMLDILGYGNVDGAPPRRDHEGHTKYEDSDEYEESSMIKGNLYNMAKQAQELHDAIEDGDDLPEWVQEKIAVASEMIDVIYDYLGAEMARSDMHEGKKPWYMKRRRNMKKTSETAWYDIPKHKAKRPKGMSKKKVNESQPGAKRPPQATDIDPGPEDEGKYYSGAGKIDDVDVDGNVNLPKKMKEFDIYRDYR